MEGHWHLEYGGQGCCQKLPTMHMTAPMTNKGPAPNTNSAQVEKTCSKSLPCQKGNSKSPHPGGGSD